MAALDPNYGFLFAAGAPTVGNLNAAAGAPQLTVAAVHFLHVVSGGTLPPAPGAANRFLVPWTDVDITSHTTLIGHAVLLRCTNDA